MKKEISNKTWLLILAGILIICAIAAAVLFFMPSSPGNVAVIILDGEEIERVDLSRVRETSILRLTGKSGITNVVEIAPGKIRVQEASCPDRVCVFQGWLESGPLPIVCLPNQLMIFIEDDGDIDARTG